MTDITGTWKVEGNNKVYIQKPYRIVFVQMPETEGDMQKRYEISLYKNDQAAMKFGFTKERHGGITKYFLLEIGEDRYTYAVRDYGGVEQDKDILAIHCIERYERFEKDVLIHLTPDEYRNVRIQVQEKLSTMFDEVRALYVLGSTPYFLMLKFAPKETLRHHALYVAYDYKNGRVNILTTKESLEGFLTRNRIEINNGTNEPLIQEKNKDALITIIRRSSVHQFNWVVSSIADILDISFVTKENEAEVRERLLAVEKRIVPPSIIDGRMRMLFISTWFPGELEEWTITENEGKIRIATEIIMRDVYAPLFLTKNPEAQDKTGHYR